MFGRLALRCIPLLMLAALEHAPPAFGEVISKTEQGFVVRLVTTVKADALTSWEVLGRPATWWSPAHTFSGDAANLAIDMVAGGCFCETLPAPKEQPRASLRGSAEHMRVVYAERARLLRLVGALGPLQSEALHATLSISLKPAEAGGTQIVWEYVVGGYMRYKADEIAPAVDGVLKEQLASLAARIDDPNGVKSSRRARPPRH